MKVGDYVRTPQGIITKIVNIQEDTGQYFLNGNAVSLESKNYIADKNIIIGENFKHSPNIIDLIEVGDYVNGHLVKNRRASCNENLGGHPKQVDIGENEDYIWISESKIKSIVTKEQFKNMEYEVK